jgi:hypothetical protein
MVGGAIADPTDHNLVAACRHQLARKSSSDIAICENSFSIFLSTVTKNIPKSSANGTNSQS